MVIGFRTFFFLLLSLLPITVFAGGDNDLQRLFAAILKQQSDSAMLQAAENFDTAFTLRLQEEDAFTTDFADLPNIGKIYSDDGKLRIISWNFQLPSGLYGYVCHFLYKESKNAPVRHFSVKTSRAYRPAENRNIRAGAWYGALYYAAIKHKKNYLLLGFSQYNNISKMKIIDVLPAGQKQTSFGSRIFKPYPGSEKSTYRVVFEYNNIADMNLKYDNAKRCFIFDHLSPEQASLKGMYQYYGPDFSIDALRFKKKFWTLEEDIDQRNNF